MPMLAKLVYYTMNAVRDDRLGYLNEYGITS